MWIMWKLRFQKCEFYENWDFRNVNFVKIEILKTSDFLDKMWVFAPVCPKSVLNLKTSVLEAKVKPKTWSYFTILYFFFLTSAIWRSITQNLIMACVCEYVKFETRSLCQLITIIIPTQTNFFFSIFKEGLKKTQFLKM